ncbi:hypothetical protein MUB24_11985 [Lederbergia sp. NSJ-179]|uniref:hypothetical protein n=1 Tax=Lederbergia sp. NSJ-179 TaxID=2931402 RepID=UPI001FD5321B|nr:hypothetical protein [Lederbergia sp. NSJ-179]MCJ7841602.1 hypothetical protein [Lederbergia sp. NSJ-179]
MWSVSKSKWFVVFLSFILFSSICLKPVLAADKAERYEFSEQEMKVFNDFYGGPVK